MRRKKKKSLPISAAPPPGSVADIGRPDTDGQSLSRAKWNCKHPAAFEPKHGRQTVYGKTKRGAGKMPRELCERKGVEIIEAERRPDHIHTPVSVPPKCCASCVMGYPKGKKRPDDVRQVRPYEIQIREPAIPAPRPFRGRGGKEQSCGGETYRKPVGGRRKARLRNSWKWLNRLSRLRPGPRAKQ